jgi:hypothetical protein
VSEPAPALGEPGIVHAPPPELLPLLEPLPPLDPLPLLELLPLLEPLWPASIRGTPASIRGDPASLPPVVPPAAGTSVGWWFVPVVLAQNPNDVDPPGAIAAFHASDDTVSSDPETLAVPFHACWSDDW